MKGKPYVASLRDGKFFLLLAVAHFLLASQLGNGDTTHVREFHLEIMVGEFGYNTQSVKEVQLFDLQGEPDSMGSQMIISMSFASHNIFVFWRDFEGNVLLNTVLLSL